MALTVKRVMRLMRKGEPRGRYLDGGPNGIKGLYLATESRTNASWTLRYQLDGKAHWLGLGSARTFSLEQARHRAKEARQRLADGVDPIQAKRADRAAKLAASAAVRTFKECAADFIEGRRHEWRSAAHEIQWSQSLRQYVYPLIGSFDVAKVDRPSVLRVLEQHVGALRGRPAGKFWLVRTTTADRVRNRIELVLNFATARGYRPAGGENPAQWSVLSHVLPRPGKTAPKQHHAAVPFAEVPALIAQLRQHEGVSVRALQFLILTACRTGEVLGATWDEVGNLADKIWTIPAARMKRGRKEHRVPLSAAAIDLLQSAYREDGNPYLWIGIGKQRLSAEAMGRALARIRPGVTVHGFRSSFSDWAHERTAHANHTIEISLSHAVGNAVELAYRRGDMFDKRAKLMEQWGKFVTSAPVEAADVVPLRPVPVS
jgi:integrase